MSLMVWETACRQFTLETIQKATDDFNELKIVGKGGFGSVYKGVVEDGSTPTLVAVKRLNPESKQGIKEFETEINMLSRCRHCHLVNLVGYCNEHQEMILVYEYMSNGTLADHLHKKQDSSLTWERRVKICIGVARGLDYLHSGTGLSDRVIHLDVKSANILLDENWAAKIADLGLSKIGPANQLNSEVITDHVRGTRGYIDPQYMRYHKFSRKADVYAFGVVLLEVLSGTRATSGEIIPNPDTDLAKWIQKQISDETLDKIIDQRVLREIRPQCQKCFVNIISRSLHIEPKKRPTMSEVVAQLECALAYQQQTNPSTSIIEYFNPVSNQKHVGTAFENLSIDGEGSSVPRSLSVDSKTETSMDSEDLEFQSILGISVAEYIGKTRNIFGEPINNKTMVQMGLSPTCENKAQVAYKMMNQANKYDKALHFVKDLKAQWGNGISTLCLLYNATGETLTYATSHNWFGDIGPSPYPTIILNGQWGAYLHTKTPKMPSGSVAAAVYRGRYSNGAFCDRMITWSIPWQRFTQDNEVYCEINEVGHFDGAVWDTIARKTPYAGRESSAHWKDCYTKVTVESDTSPILKAIFTHVDAVVISV